MWCHVDYNSILWSVIYVIYYLLVCENRLYRDYEPYKNYLTLTEDRDEYKKRNAEKAENVYRNELMKFEERIQ